jgi:hypothetical protein
VVAAVEKLAPRFFLYAPRIEFSKVAGAQDSVWDPAVSVKAVESDRLEDASAKDEPPGAEK